MNHNTVTFYHYDEDSEIWEKRVYRNATIYRISEVSDDNAGRKKADTAKIRIFNNLSAVDVYINDYVFIGAAESLTPEKEKCLNVTLVCDRRVGTRPHWRIEAK